MIDKFDKTLIWDYLVLVFRICLAYNLLNYGWSKLTGGQFGVSEATMNQPLKDIDLMRVSWYLAAHEPFKTFIGISQLLTAGLLIYNRTAVIGAFIAIPIWLNILMWDMTFMGLFTSFTVRIPFYLLLTVLIIWHYKDKVRLALQTIFDTKPKFKFPVWAYLLIIPVGAIVELIGAMPIAIKYYLEQFFK